MERFYVVLSHQTVKRLSGSRAAFFHLGLLKPFGAPVLVVHDSGNTDPGKRQHRIAQ